MIHTDMIVVMANNNGEPPTKMDLFAIEEATPPTDESLGGRDDLFLEDWSYTETGFTAVVSRLLITGDTFDHIIKPNSEMDMICATQKKDSWTEHDFSGNF
ncbi:unnamed protein product [Blepharisma stoltei]|uniref:DOMON domain-containing protein n=1 Tax=Blepharisma stoltei TaxID=1481888 RepID=A0AAU9II22_9CILI|nr:unnamed protein product [Blepharisma stoltei]